MNIRQLIFELHQIKAIEFGRFKLKSGIVSPYYVDLRLLVSYPYLLGAVADVFWEKLRLLQFDLIVGVPYAAIPIVTTVSYKYNRPMIFVRKERKSYGKRKLIEGEFHKFQKVVLIDDVISDGASKLETIHTLKQYGLAVTHVVVLLDRLQGGKNELERVGFPCLTITNMLEVIHILESVGKISTKEKAEAIKFIN